MAVAGFYKRALPSPPAIEFSSLQGKEIFREALQAGTMEGFFNLIAYFQTQAEPAYCGLASLAVVLNALSIDPGRTWKGPWRWYDESMLDCCEPLENVKAKGITFAKLACLAKCAGAEVLTFRANQSSPAEFRDHIVQCLSSGEKHVIVSYDRRLLRQTGSGHFSPIGGYHCGRDMALVLDVARFKYPPHWVPLHVLWNAVNTVDESSGKSRGYMVISKGDASPSLLFTLSCKDEHWVALSKHLMESVPLLLQNFEFHSVQKVFEVVISSLPANIASFVNWIAEIRTVTEQAKELERDEVERLTTKSKVLKQLRETEVYIAVISVLEQRNEDCLLVSDDLPEAVAHACCQGALTLSGILDFSNAFCSYKKSVATVKASGSEYFTVVSSNVRRDGTEESIDVLVPTAPEMQDHSCGCKQMGIMPFGNLKLLHPVLKDLLAILILALPLEIWQGIHDLNVQSEICRIVSVTALPNGLREEVHHLREQFQLVDLCHKDGVDKNLECLF